MSYSVVRRQISELVLLRLWHRPAAVAPIRPQPHYAMGVALKRQKKKERKKEKKKKELHLKI